MTICVDTLTPCLKSMRWKHNLACHMVSDTFDLDELHAFAERLKLKRSWFQKGKRLPYYDLTVGKRKQAVSLGAVEVDRQFVYDLMKKSPYFMM